MTFNEYQKETMRTASWRVYRHHEKTYVLGT